MQHCVRVLDCVLLAWVLEQEPLGLTSSTEGNSHKFSLMPDFYFVHEAKKIRLPVLQTAPGTFYLPVLPSLKDIRR